MASLFQPAQYPQVAGSSFARAAPVLQGVGTALSTFGAIQQGNAAVASGNYVARQLDYRAGQTMASAERAASNERLKARYAVSRGRAVAAASGAGATDPSVINTEGDISARGEYEALTRMYEGADAAAGLRASAAVQRRQGSAGQTASYLRAGSTVLNGGISLWDKYGR